MSVLFMMECYNCHTRFPASCSICGGEVIDSDGEPQCKDCNHTIDWLKCRLCGTTVYRRQIGMIKTHSN